MRCDEMNEKLPELLNGTLASEEVARLRAHLESCPGCAEEAASLESLWARLGELPDEEPSSTLRARFDTRLAQEIAAESRRIVPFARREPAPARRLVPSGAFGALAASVALVAIGVLVGAQLSSSKNAREMQALQRDIRSLHETVAVALLQGDSAATRLEGVAYGREASVTDDKVAAAMFEALLKDPNVNVRLAALDALKPRAARPEERPRLVAAVAAQDSPLVQLSLLSLLLESAQEGPNAAAVRRDLAQLLDNQKLDPVVRGYLRDQLGRSI
jgi:hypothetical protein